jgi:hypothetical protein
VEEKTADLYDSWELKKKKKEMEEGWSVREIVVTRERDHYVTTAGVYWNTRRDM